MRIASSAKEAREFNRIHRLWDGNGGNRLFFVFCFFFLKNNQNNRTPWCGKLCGKLRSGMVNVVVNSSERVQVTERGGVRVFHIVFLYPVVFRIVFHAQVS